MGIFDSSVDANIFTTYQVRLQIRSWLVGGTPKDPKMIAGWLRKHSGLIEGSEELRLWLLRTLRETGKEVDEEMSYDDLLKLSQQYAEDNHTVGFREDREQGLYLESRCVKSMLKECANIWLAGKLGLKLGLTNKGPKNYVAESVFIDRERIYLGVLEPTGIHQFIGHTSGPQGPQSSLTYYEYVERPTLTFCVQVAGDGIEHAHWAAVWRLAQENGLGSLRSQGFGTFDIEQWEQIGDKGIGAKKRELVQNKPNGKVEPPVTLVLA